MAQRTITESQYMELRKYEDGNDHWVAGGPNASLERLGLISWARHDPSMFKVTEAGRDALSAFRARYGL